MKTNFGKYKEIWFVDFEFQQSGSSVVTPVCLVAHELKSNVKFKLWKDDMEKLSSPPYGCGRDSLFVSYFASAELSCHLALKWELPQNILDLYVEFRNITNGRHLSAGKSLLGALSYFGITAIPSDEKERMRRLILGQNFWSGQERADILEYCESDVLALRALFEKMNEHIHIGHALLRGEYMKSVSRIELQGIPVDEHSLALIRTNVDTIQNLLIDKVDPARVIFDGTTFKEEGFRRFIRHHQINWPTLNSGKLRLDDETFKSVAAREEIIKPIRQLRQSLSQLRNNALTVDAGITRCMVSPFSSKTSRNQPSNSKFIFGLAKWFRFLIKPKQGTAIAYIDWSQHEFGIAAALSGDEAMKNAYSSGDPYLTFAKQAGAVPPNATKESHERERNLFKECSLAVQYGMGASGLASKIGKTKSEARELIDLHKRTYPRFWLWSDASIQRGMQSNIMHTVFGWKLNITDEATVPSLKNFPMQSNGAEMLRLSAIFAHEKGVKICALVHDAILIEAPRNLIDDHAAKAQEAMAEASEIVLDGFRLSTEAKVFRYPDRFVEKKGRDFWDSVQECLSKMNPPDGSSTTNPPNIGRVLPHNLSPDLSH